MRNRHWRRSVRCAYHDFTGLEGVDSLQREKMMSKKKALIGAALAGVMGVVGAAEIEFVVGGKVYPGTLNDSGAAQALFERLPLEVTFEDFGSNERIAYVKPELSLSGKADHGAPKPGTFAVYEPWGYLRFSRALPCVERSLHPGRGSARDARSDREERVGDRHDSGVGALKRQPLKEVGRGLE